VPNRGFLKKSVAGFNSRSSPFIRRDTHALRNSNTISTPVIPPSSSPRIHILNLLFETPWGKIPTRSVILDNGIKDPLKSEHLCEMLERFERLNPVLRYIRDFQVRL